MPDSAIAHYDAQNSGSVITSGGSVTDWNDQEGSRDLSGTATDYVSSAINGNPAIQFDGTDDVLTVAFSAISQPTTIFAVVQTDDADSFQAAFSGESSTHDIGQGISGGKQIINAGTSVTAGTADTNPVLLTAVFDGANSVLRDNGTEIATGDAGTNALNGISAGARTGNDFFYDGYIGELLPLNERASQTTIDEQEQRMADRWGITI